MNTSFNKADFSMMQQYFFSGATQSYTFRKKQLLILKGAIKKNEKALSQALYKDMHKPRAESFLTEIGFIYAEIAFSIRYLKNWMYTQRVNSPLVLFPSRSKIIKSPLGLALIISPWNYPVQLSFGPLAAAIAGGNCIVLKPSEYTPNTTEVIRNLIEENFDKRYISVVTGNGSQVVPELMRENRFDHVFFTGSTMVGKEIARLAAEKIVPVTLELGGKSPCIVDKSVNVEVAAQRITWGKFTNAGQTCVAPDYLLVHERRRDELIHNIEKAIKKYYGVDPLRSADYGRIINEKRFDKLYDYLEQGEIITGGTAIREELYIAPTLMQHVSQEQPVMQEEIFGPLLPVYTYKEHDEALGIIRNNPYPLSLYVFTNNITIEKMYTERVQFGGGCINNTLVHLGNPALPFGGVGNSGTGVYHGQYGFDTFTRAKAIVKTGTWLDPSLKYPPYKGKLPLLRWFFR